MIHVRKEITVDAPVERAFEMFTTRFDSWWPRSHKIGQADLQEAIIEPRTGGRWYERDIDGSECEWGEVLAWEPPHRVVLTWHLDGEWVYRADRFSEIEVSFTPQGASTLVALEHRHLERHGETAEAIREAVSSVGGWPGLLNRYAEVLGSRSSAAELMQ